MKKIILFGIALCVSLGTWAQNNTLTDAEKAEGWKLLFDGQTTNGWRNYNAKTIGQAWKVEDGCITLDCSKKEGWQVVGGGDIVTEKAYKNYEFSIDWKISKNGNSGLIFNVKEKKKLQYAWNSGPEMQVADEGHPDAKIFKHAAGDLYDLIPSASKVAKFGEWNTARIVNNRGLLQLFLNGTKVVETRIDDQAWKDLVASSKFKQWPAFGTFLGGRICLQDHGDPVWFRNIKIKKL